MSSQPAAASLQPRDVDGRPCALRTCGTPISPDATGVRIATPVKALKRVPGGKAGLSALSVAWDAAAPRTYFHSACFDRLCQHKPPISSAEAKLLDACTFSAETFQPLAAARAFAKELAQLIRRSSHTVAFTGAGISVSAGIPDYRGTAGIDVLGELGVAAGAATGWKRAGGEEAGGEAPAAGGSAAGRGEKRAKTGASASASASASAPPPSAEQQALEAAVEASESYTRLRPTLTHRTLKDLHAAKLLHYVISQNCDGLHARSGLPRDALSELHGNVFVEFCERCSAEYPRPYCVDLSSTDCRGEPWHEECPQCHWGHYTGRVCERAGCGGRLRDTIVNFGDDLHDAVLGGLPRAEEQCRKATLILCLGSSLTVTPASELPRLMKRRKGALAIVNLQETEHDAVCALRLFYDLDAFCALLREELGEGHLGLGSAGAAAAPAPPSSAGGKASH
jgi:NAD-dependent SIR2 family protein deacetylase